MARIIPFFEVNGNKYEIKKTRYLQAEFDNMKKAIEMDSEEEVVYAKEQELRDKAEKLLNRKNELYDKYLDTFSDEDEELYNKACKAYDKMLEELQKLDNVVGKQNEKLVKIGEEIIIKALQINDNGEKIMDKDKAEEIWKSFVIENSEIRAIEFVIYTLNYIVGADDEELPFVMQAKAKAEQRMNMKKGIKTIK